MKTPYVPDNNVGKINGKTPEEIKKGLSACSADECHGQHEGCTYQDQLFCTMRMCGDALAYIQQLETRLAQAERERDALMAYVPHNCYSCKHEETRYECGRPCNWEWRGVCEENSK